MKILAITQARYSSSRLEGKVLLPLAEKTVLDLHLQRVKKSTLVNDFILATTFENKSEEILAIATRNNFDTFQGSLDDVLDRFYHAAKKYNPDYVVRLTSDCPLIDAEYIDDLIRKFLEAKCDYAANCIEPTLPDGMDAEVFTFSALEKAWQNAQKKSEREHVTLYIRESGMFKVLSIKYPLNYGQFRLTLDTEEDFRLITELVRVCGKDKKMEDYVKHLQTHPELLKINEKFERNEGLKKSLKEDCNVKPNN